MFDADASADVSPAAREAATNQSEADGTAHRHHNLAPCDSICLAAPSSLIFGKW